jgi:hypothetical protein
MTTKKAATGPSRAVHGCKMPSDRVEGAVFRCGCGGYWRLRIQDGELSIWWPVSAAEAERSDD